MSLFYGGPVIYFWRVDFGVEFKFIDFDIQQCIELCNVNYLDHQLLISPLYDSSIRGLSDMACLIGYLNNDGNAKDILLKTCATVVHFPPFITSMHRIIEQNQIVGRDIATFCSAMFTFMKFYLPKTCPDDQVFEYLLRMCNVISQVQDAPEKLPILEVEVDHNSPDEKFLCDLKLGPVVYFWRVDFGEEFKFIDNELVNNVIENAYKCNSLFTPIALLSVYSVTVRL